jgi:hypothetical protein
MGYPDIIIVTVGSGMGGLLLRVAVLDGYDTTSCSGDHLIGLVAVDFDCIEISLPSGWWVVKSSKTRTAVPSAKGRR